MDSIEVARRRERLLRKLRLRLLAVETSAEADNLEKIVRNALREATLPADGKTSRATKTSAI